MTEIDKNKSENDAIEMTEEFFYKWVGNKLRELREKAGIKKKDLAKKLKIAPTFLSNIENDGKKVSAFQINRILNVMGYTQADLVEGDEGKKNSLCPSMATS